MCACGWGQSQRHCVGSVSLEGPSGSPAVDGTWSGAQGRRVGCGDCPETAAPMRCLKSDGLPCVERAERRGDASKPWGLPASRGQEGGQEPGLEIAERQPGSE